MGNSCSSKEDNNVISSSADNTDDMNLSEKEYKTRLEQKLMIFRETPEPVCDLSECNLEKLPGNSLFSIIKVLRKEILILGKNRLKSLASGGPLNELELLQVLDLSHNKFKVIPVEICMLKNLRVSHQRRIFIKNSWKNNFLCLFLGTFSIEQPVNTPAIHNQSTQKTRVIRCFEQQPYGHPIYFLHARTKNIECVRK
jgi:hypothetical protein